jgi:hypothetical protein
VVPGQRPERFRGEVVVAFDAGLELGHLVVHATS